MEDIKVGNGNQGILNVARIEECKFLSRKNTTTSSGRGAKDSELHLLKQQAGIVPAETEAVAHGVGDFLFFGFVGGVVEIAFWIGGVQIDGWGDHVVLDGFAGDDGFDAAGSAE